MTASAPDLVIRCVVSPPFEVSVLITAVPPMTPVIMVRPAAVIVSVRSSTMSPLTVLSRLSVELLVKVTLAPIVTGSL